METSAERNLQVMSEGNSLFDWAYFIIDLLARVVFLVSGVPLCYLLAFALIAGFEFLKNGYKYKPPSKDMTLFLTGILGLYYAITAISLGLGYEQRPIWKCILLSLGIVLVGATLLSIAGGLVSALYKGTTRLRDWLHAEPRSRTDETELGEVESGVGGDEAVERLLHGKGDHGARK